MPHVLLMDDDTILLQSLSRHFVQKGFQVSLANNGTEGLDKIRDTLPDLVVTDLLMPGVGGIEFLYKIQKIRADIKVIVLSGGVEYFRVAKQLGAVQTLSKPCPVEKIMDAVQEALSEPSP